MTNMRSPPIPFSLTGRAYLTLANSVIEGQSMVSFFDIFRDLEMRGKSKIIR